MSTVSLCIQRVFEHPLHAVQTVGAPAPCRDRNVLTNKTISSATVANAYTIQHCVCTVVRAVRAIEYYCTVRYGGGAPKKPNCHFYSQSHAWYSRRCSSSSHVTQPTHHLFAQSTYGISAYRQYRPYTTTRQHSSAASLSRAPEFEFMPTRLLENN